MADEERNPIDQLVDLFVYAPVGLLYEYDEVVPRLVKRGKSQVALARFVGKMAMGRSPVDIDNSVNAVARVITDLGAAIGLAPSPDQAPREGSSAPPPPSVVEVQVADPDGGEAAVDAGESATEAGEVRQLPIARYDDLTAKEIIPLLDELDLGQLARIRAHEEDNRARKTVLGKLDRLER